MVQDQAKWRLEKVSRKANGILVGFAYTRLVQTSGYPTELDLRYGAKGHIVRGGSYQTYNDRYSFPRSQRKKGRTIGTDYHLSSFRSADRDVLPEGKRRFDVGFRLVAEVRK